MASPGLPESITAGVTTGHVTDHEKIHDLLNEFDMAQQAQATGDLLVFQDGLIKRLPVGSDNQVLTADSTQDAGVRWATPTGGGGGGGGDDVWELVDEQTLASDGDEFDFTNLSASYVIFRLVLNWSAVTSNNFPVMRFNGDSGGSSYTRLGWSRGNNSNTGSGNVQNRAEWPFATMNSISAGAVGVALAMITQLTASDEADMAAEAKTTGTLNHYRALGRWANGSNQKINRIHVFGLTGPMAAGSTCRLEAATELPNPFSMLPLLAMPL